MSNEETITQLKKELEEEKRRNRQLENEIANYRDKIQQMTLATEAEEESISLKLMERLRTLSQEKEKIILASESEEEKLTNNLQRKMEDLQKEKIHLQNTLEYEEEAIMHRLQRQIADVQREKDEYKRKVCESTTLIDQIKKNLVKIETVLPAEYGQITFQMCEDLDSILAQNRLYLDEEMKYTELNQQLTGKVGRLEDTVKQLNLKIQEQSQ